MDICGTIEKIKPGYLAHTLWLSMECPLPKEFTFLKCMYYMQVKPDFMQKLLAASSFEVQRPPGSGNIMPEKIQSLNMTGFPAIYFIILGKKKNILTLDKAF